jgi:endonuclease I
MGTRADVGGMQVLPISHVAAQVGAPPVAVAAPPVAFAAPATKSGDAPVVVPVDYASAQGLEGVALLRGLSTITKSAHVERSYGKAVSELFANAADPDNDNTVLDVYTGAAVSGVASKLGGWARRLSVEHVWPRSQGATGVANSDLHHLHVARRGANRMRSNLPLGEVVTPTWTSTGAAAGRSQRGGSSSGATVFEPADPVKGDLARSLLYVATRYGADQPERWDPANFRRSLPELLRWHAADPVSDAERARNDVVHAFQGNRNPYVDHPRFAAKVGLEAFLKA